VERSAIHEAPKPRIAGLFFRHGKAMRAALVYDARYRTDEPNR
jgi:hypothetical protein